MVRVEGISFIIRGILFIFTNNDDNDSRMGLMKYVGYVEMWIMFIGSGQHITLR
jgi:hypothetical protein